MPNTTEQRENSPKDYPSGAFCYGFGPLVPLVYLFRVQRNQQDPFLHFHYIQCLILFLLLGPIMLLKFVSADIMTAAFVLLFLGLLVAMFQAARGNRFHLPLVGWLAERFV
jgi:uncharacterized membrane protein